MALALIQIYNLHDKNACKRITIFCAYHYILVEWAKTSKNIHKLSLICRSDSSVVFSDVFRRSLYCISHQRSCETSFSLRLFAIYVSFRTYIIYAPSTIHNTVETHAKPNMYGSHFQKSHIESAYTERTYVACGTVHK